VTQFCFSFDVSRCSGCMACVVACMDQNDLPGDDGVSFRHVTKLEQGHYPAAKISFVSLACQHCGDAPCSMACPTNAIFRTREDGSIDVNEEFCIGCHSCVQVCPFGAPQFPEEGKMSKCNRCFERVENGMEPACVHTCTTRALGFGTMEELSEEKAGKASVRILEGLLSGSPENP